MIINKNQQAEFLEASKPLIKFINNNCHPHVKVIVDCDSSEILESFSRQITDEFIND